MVIKSMQLL